MTVAWTEELVWSWGNWCDAEIGFSSLVFEFLFPLRIFDSVGKVFKLLIDLSNLLLLAPCVHFVFPYISLLLLNLNLDVFDLLVHAAFLPQALRRRTHLCIERVVNGHLVLVHFCVVGCELVQLCFFHAQAVLEPQHKLVLVNFRKLFFHFLHFLA